MASVRRCARCSNGCATRDVLKLLERSRVWRYSESVRSSKSIARSAPPLYEADYYAWIRDQVHALRAGRLSDLDGENVAEELEDLGKAVRRELQSRLELILSHLLKWAYQPDRRSSSWENTIDEQRRRVSDLIDKNPSLKSCLDEVADDAYRYARGSAGNDMGLGPRAWRRHFPSASPWSLSQILNTSFLPETRPN